MIMILIIGRWLLPQSKLSRDQLLQLLLMQIGIAADSLEFLTDTLATELMDQKGVILVLSFWSWSLPQFTLTMNLTKTKKFRATARQENPKCYTEECKDFYEWPDLFFATEMWSIFLNILMQDLPFLVVRLYLIGSSISVVIINQPILYFVAKNVMVILVQSYRMAAIVAENRSKRALWQAFILGSTENSSKTHPGLEVSPKEDPQELIRAQPGVYEYAWYVKAMILQFAKERLNPISPRENGSQI
ncbi:transmembrane protein 26-like [Patiria miniata]|uniref:Transmembrane protein 26 n=1 Tax=Patiria miniata TaxID=46514 RepID=A0A914BAX0_PATMI|nr:transmembrane protein 26-like [Patiria miniata]